MLTFSANRLLGKGVFFDKNVSNDLSRFVVTSIPCFKRNLSSKGSSKSNDIGVIKIDASGNTVEQDVTDKEPISNNERFRRIVPDRKVVTYLDTLKLGYLPVKRERVAIAMKYGNVKGQKRSDISTEVLETPFPFSKNVKVIGTAKTIEEAPRLMNDPPEVAIIGRSNVGKSTLVNALVGFDSSYVQKAGVSAKPGFTKALHFFAINHKTTKAASDLVSTRGDGNTNGESSNRLMRRLKRDERPIHDCSLVIVDFPGYGFAYMSPADALQCKELTSSYLLGNRKNLKRVLLLVDARHGLKIGDKKYFQELIYGSGNDDQDVLLDATNTSKSANPTSAAAIRAKINWKLQIVLTKCDLVSRADLARRVTVLKSELSEALPGLNNMLPIMFVSGVEKKGITQLQQELASLVARKQSSSSNDKWGRGIVEVLPSNQ